MKPDTHHPLILYDGVCNLCESTVHWIIRHDGKACFRFESLQSDTGQRVLAGFQYANQYLDSVLLVADGRLYYKSRAALRIAKQLDGVWRALFYLFFWVPPFIADLVYDFVGNRRYRWFGKKEECWIPNHDLRQRFFDDSTTAT
jgi:predicted DCC family thiol-disulfide oxidoreductase YuxK